MLDFVGISGKVGLRPDDLTLVDQRRLEIARALASGPELLLLDEPAAGMNLTELGELGALIGRIQAKGVTILLVEHHMQLVMAIANCITVLSAGQCHCGRSAAHRPARSGGHLRLSGEWR